jgi:hypothetical protein
MGSHASLGLAGSVRDRGDRALQHLGGFGQRQLFEHPQRERFALWSG